MSQPVPTAKVLFRLVKQDGTSNVETLWAFDLGDDLYRLDNSPFYAYSVSAGDVVLAPVDLAGGVLPESDFAAVCARLIGGGVQWEHADPSYSELYPDAV
jgi:Domain of unknown function (DUF4265)